VKVAFDSFVGKGCYLCARDEVLREVGWRWESAADALITATSAAEPIS
jgi:hypothetical protein